MVMEEMIEYRIVLYNVKLNEKTNLGGRYTKEQAISEVDNLRQDGLPAFYEEMK